MSDHHTYKKVELVGSSPSSIEDAIANALAEANKSINLRGDFAFQFFARLTRCKGGACQTQ